MALPEVLPVQRYDYATKGFLLSDPAGLPISVEMPGDGSTFSPADQASKLHVQLEGSMELLFQSIPYLCSGSDLEKKCRGSWLQAYGESCGHCVPGGWSWRGQWL
jgi:hypothetical protein